MSEEKAALAFSSAGRQQRLFPEVRAALPAQRPAGYRASFPALSERERSGPHPGPSAGH